MIAIPSNNYFLFQSITIGTLGILFTKIILFLETLVRTETYSIFENSLFPDPTALFLQTSSRKHELYGYLIQYLSNCS